MRVLHLNAPATGFSPLPSEVGTLKYWFEFDTASVTLSGSDIDAMDNKEGTAGWDLTDGGAATKIQHVASGPNGQPYGAGDGTAFINSDTSQANTTSMTIIMVVRQDAWTSADRVISSSGGSGPLVFQNSASPQLWAWSGTGRSVGSLTLDTWGIVAVQFDTTTAKGAINSTTLSSLGGGTGSSVANGVRLFGGSTTQVGDFDLAFVAGYSAITDAEYTNLINGYVASKFGITVS